ncbi:hypothetical protein BACILLUS_005788 (plasmid) [Priestia megaterium]
MTNLLLNLDIFISVMEAIQTFPKTSTGVLVISIEVLVFSPILI